MIKIADPECRLALAYVPANQRAAMTALWALDELLSGILRGGRAPIVSQMRLTWWHDALTRVDTALAPAQPVLEAISRDVLPHGVTGAQLAVMIEGWEALLDEGALGDVALAQYATARGRVLFAAMGHLLGVSDDAIGAAGEGWALVDLGLHLSDPALAARALALATPLLQSALAVRWSRAARPLGMLAHLARIDAAATRETIRRQGSPARVVRMMRHWLTGR